MTLFKTAVFISGWTWTVRNGKTALFRATTVGSGTRMALCRGPCRSSQEGYKMRKRHNHKKWGMKKVKPH
jgi:hypothetical protein